MTKFWNKSWNVITGCNEISEGCASCWARRFANRLKGRCGYDKDNPFKITYHPERLLQPMKVKKPSVIFVCSMADIFHPDVDNTAIDSILDVVAACPKHIFLMLTKRPENIRAGAHCRIVGEYPNLWLGVTCENQARADERIPKLLDSWSGHKWICAEPLLSYMLISFYLGRGYVEWVVSGNETGKGARACDTEWVDDLAGRCKGAKIPFFWKGNKEVREGINRQEWPEEMKKLKEVG